MNRVWWKTLVRKLDYTPLPASGWPTLHPQKIFGPKVTTGQGFINAGCMKYNYIRTSTNSRFPRMPHLHPSTYRTQNPLWQRYVLVSILEIVIYIYMKTGPIMYSFYKIISFISLDPNQVLQKGCLTNIKIYQGTSRSPKRSSTKMPGPWGRDAVACSPPVHLLAVPGRHERLRPCCRPWRENSRSPCPTMAWPTNGRPANEMPDMWL